MPSWKKNIFVNAIRTRIVQEGRTSAAIIEDYLSLTEAEKAEILAAI